jgi:hypothetical protein
MKKIIETAHVKVDPLYVIFEKHLYNIENPEMDRGGFIAGIVRDYLTFLRNRKVVVPKSLEPSIIEELGTQVNVMLVKKIYGFVSIDEFVRRAAPAEKRRSQSRYRNLTRASTPAKRVKREKKTSAL